MTSRVRAKAFACLTIRPREPRIQRRQQRRLKAQNGRPQREQRRMSGPIRLPEARCTGSSPIFRRHTACHGTTMLRQRHIVGHAVGREIDERLQGATPMLDAVPPANAPLQVRGACRSRTMSRSAVSATRSRDVRRVKGPPRIHTRYDRCARTVISVTGIAPQSSSGPVNESRAWPGGLCC